MGAIDAQQMSSIVCPIPQTDGLGYTLVEDDALDDGDCYIALVSPDGIAKVVALFDNATGNAFACGQSEDPRVSDIQPAPDVRIVGDLGGQTGQVTILQPDGSYRRYSRWDRVDHGSPAQPNAIVRTLPQCGCGGSLGMPRLFDSFAEMSAYFFCTFALDHQHSAV